MRKRGVGGTVCVRDLLYLLRNRVNFDKFQESDVRFGCSRKALAKTRRRRRGFSDSSEHESGKALAKVQRASVEDTCRQAERERFENFKLESKTTA